jgi:hypothetical protein
MTNTHPHMPEIAALLATYLRQTTGRNIAALVGTDDDGETCIRVSEFFLYEGGFSEWTLFLVVPPGEFEEHWLVEQEIEYIGSQYKTLIETPNLILVLKCLSDTLNHDKMAGILEAFGYDIDKLYNGKSTNRGVE